MKEVRITAGTHKGKVGRLIEEGTFNVFGKTLTGAKIQADGAGPYAIPAGEYEILEEIVEDTEYYYIEA